MSQNFNKNVTEVMLVQEDPWKLTPVFLILAGRYKLGISLPLRTRTGSALEAHAPKSSWHLAIGGSTRAQSP
jgi:hypothetical protein